LFELVGDADAGACIDGVCAMPVKIADEAVQPESTTSFGSRDQNG
jgi:hypothetical protein